MKSYYFPLKCLLISWGVVYSIRIAGLMDYENVSILTHACIISFVVIFAIGFYAGVINIVKFKRYFALSYRYPDPMKSLNLLVFITVTFTIICVFFMFLKMRGLSQRYDTGLSFQGFSEIRGATMNDDSTELGSSVYGMISTILFGFPLVSGLMAVYYRSHLTKLKIRLLLGAFILGALASFMTGGRFTAFTFIIMYLFARKIKTVKFNKAAKYTVAFSVIVFVIISGQIFIDRMGNQDISEVAYHLKLCKPKEITKSLLDYSPNFVTIVIYFEYYVAHGINQLDVLLTAQPPVNFPYLGAYQFKTFVMMLNKFGFNIINSQQIVSEIVNPGVYFTEVGALYLDFGFVLSAIMIFIFSFVTGVVWRRFLTFDHFADFFTSIIFLSLIAVSAIVSLIGAGYFSAILVASVFISIYCKFLPLPIPKK